MQTKVPKFSVAVPSLAAETAVSGLIAAQGEGSKLITTLWVWAGECGATATAAGDTDQETLQSQQPHQEEKIGIVWGLLPSEQLLNTHTWSYFHTKFALCTHNQVRALKPQEPKQTGDITEKTQTEEGRAGGKGSHCRERLTSFYPALIQLTAWNKLLCGYDSLLSFMLNSQSKTPQLCLPLSASGSCSWGTPAEKKVPIQTRAL